MVLCLMYLVMYMERVNIATAAPYMTADLGLNNTQFGLAISAFSYPYALFQLIGGWISDRFG
ncbi:MAG: MFS transporter, partial [Terriglobales bacterium]